LHYRLHFSVRNLRPPTRIGVGSSRQASERVTQSHSGNTEQGVARRFYGWRTECRDVIRVTRNPRKVGSRARFAATP
jgi:hypothetical protein